jgi:hypothetical protein
MKATNLWPFGCLWVFLSLSVSHAQVGPQSTSANLIVPRQIKFSGVLLDDAGKPMTGVVGVTFSIHAVQQGGTPLWLETQNVQPGAAGRYTVFLGATNGIPVELFSSGEA